VFERMGLECIRDAYVVKTRVSGLEYSTDRVDGVYRSRVKWLSVIERLGATSAGVRRCTDPKLFVGDFGQLLS